MPDIADHLILLETPAPNPSILVSAYFSQDFGYAVRRPRGTRDWLIAFTLAGQGSFQQGGQVILCQAGDVALLQPESVHHYETASRNEPWQFIWAHFIPRPDWIAWLELPNLNNGLGYYAVFEAETRSQVEKAMRRMVAESVLKGPFQEELAQNALEEALILIRREIASLEPNFPDTRVDAVQKYLEQHFNQTFSLPDLAKMVWLSPWRLSHLYKQKTGQTISDFQTRLRLRQATRLLGFTSRKIEEIARDVGFESPYYFSRLFKRYYGVSPRKYRNQNQPGDDDNTEFEC